MSLSMDSKTPPANTHTIPQFIRKLYNILNDPQHHEHIHWSQGGDSFIIVNPIEFCDTVLTSNFKHSNISSFIRQLNKYDFHKIRAPASSKKRIQTRMWEFSHPNFRKNRADLLVYITRKTGLAEKNIQDGQQETENESTMMFHNYVINSMASITKYFEMITEDLNNIKKILHKQQYGTTEQFLKVLIAEDNATCASYASLIFKRLSFLCVSVESIADFSFFFKNETFDMILLSSHLPNIKEIINKIRSKSGAIPIILTTEEKEDIQTLYYKYPSINKILYKPYSHEELVGYIKSLNQSFTKQNDDERRTPQRFFYS